MQNSRDLWGDHERLCNCSTANMDKTTIHMPDSVLSCFAGTVKSFTLYHLLETTNLKFKTKAQC